MLKLVFYLFLAVIVLIIVVTAVRMQSKDISQTKSEQTKPKELQIIYYHQGKNAKLNKNTKEFDELLMEANNLFLTADTTYRMILDAKRLEDIKNKQTAIEVIFPDVQNGTLYIQRKVSYTKLLIPLSGEFTAGTIFFAGRNVPDDDQFLNYADLQEYGSTNFVRNTKGLDKLKNIIQRINISP